MGAVVHPELIGQRPQGGAFIVSVVHRVVSHEDPMHVFGQLAQGFERGALAFLGIQPSDRPHQPRVLGKVQFAAQAAFSRRLGCKPSVVEGEGKHMATCFFDGCARQAFLLEVVKSAHPCIDMPLPEPMPRRFFGLGNLHRLLHDQAGPKCFCGHSCKTQIPTVPDPKDVACTPFGPSPRCPAKPCPGRGWCRGHVQLHFRALLPRFGIQRHHHFDVVSSFTHPPCHHQHVALETSPTFGRGEKAYVVFIQ